MRQECTHNTHKRAHAQCSSIALIVLALTRSPKLDTPIRIDIYMDDSEPGGKPSRVLVERWSIRVVQRCSTMLDPLLL